MTVKLCKIRAIAGFHGHFITVNHSKKEVTIAFSQSNQFFDEPIPEYMTTSQYENFRQLRNQHIEEEAKMFAASSFPILLKLNIGFAF